MSKYVIVTDGKYIIVDLDKMQADSVVIGEVLSEVGGDYRIGLLNPWVKDTFFYPLNMFSGPVVLFSELVSLMECESCQP